MTKTPNDNDSDLQAYLDGRDGVSDTYRALDSGEPSSALDKLILAEARSATDDGATTPRSRSPMLQSRYSVAASVALCLMIGSLYLGDQALRPGQQERRVAADSIYSPTIILSDEAAGTDRLVSADLVNDQQPETGGNLVFSGDERLREQVVSSQLTAEARQVLDDLAAERAAASGVGDMDSSNIARAVEEELAATPVPSVPTTVPQSIGEVAEQKTGAQDDIALVSATETTTSANPTFRYAENAARADEQAAGLTGDEAEADEFRTSFADLPSLRDSATAPASEREEMEIVVTGSRILSGFTGTRPAPDAGASRLPAVEISSPPETDASVVLGPEFRLDAVTWAEEIFYLRMEAADLQSMLDEELTLFRQRFPDADLDALLQQFEEEIDQQQ